MSEKTYDSIVYYAQVFKSCLIDIHSMRRLQLGTVIAKQSNNTVSFKLGDINTYVKFEYRGEKPYIVLEMELVNGEGNLRTETIEKVMKIKRSKTGRISGAYYPKVLNDFIMPNIKRFHDKWVR